MTTDMPTNSPTLYVLKGSVQSDLFKGMDSEPHKMPYVYVKYHHKFIPGTRECISGLLRKIFVFKVGKPSFFPASE